jgi:TonB-dependent SusC/RagA subfamily outer membrane receptor
MLKELRLSAVAIVLAASVSSAQTPDSLVPILISDPRADEPCAETVGAIGATPALPRCERGGAITILDATDGINTTRSLALALQARVPGVSVSQGEGFLGSSSRVWLRGPSSLVVNQPLLIIDGARTHAASPDRGFIDRDLPSRLEDLDMEMVERIEVLRGPAAAAIYGPGASKGVILVTTKRGVPGPARWTAFAESGPSIETTSFPANFGTLGVATSGGAPVANCPLANQAAGSCTPIARQSWNPLESASPFRTGWTNGAGLTAAGSVGSTTWLVGGSHDRAEGVYETDRSRATNVRVALAASPTSTIDVRLTGGQLVDRLRHPAYSWITTGLTGASADAPATRGYVGGDTFDRMASTARDEDVRRTTASLDATWRVRPWLRASALLGYDRLGIGSALTRRDAFGFPTPTDSSTFVERTSDRPETRTASIAATASYPFRGLAARSAVGIQYIRDDDNATEYNAVYLDDPDAPLSFSVAALDHRRSSTGVYLQQHVGWENRLFVTGSARLDRGNADDVDMDNIVSRSIDVAWLAFAGSSSPQWLEELRLRGAYGSGGDHLVITRRTNNLNGPGSATTEPAEQGTEMEIGTDAALLDYRVRAAVTYFRDGTRRGFEVIPTFQGPVLTNYARVKTSGLETAVDARVLSTDLFEWEVGVTHSVRHNEIDHMGGPPNANSDHQVSGPGNSIGEYFEAPYTVVDANGDGLIAQGDVTVLGADFGSIGSAFPTQEAAVRTSLSVGRVVHLSAIVDHRGGAKLFNQTSRVRCRTRCEAQHDPALPLADQARSVASQRGSDLGYIEDADYTKLREVRIALTLPSRMARLGGASSATLSVTGRNLYTWTQYSGLDPEITSGRYDTITAADAFYQPTVRSFVARLDLKW